ncbi:MAG: alanine racemase, partial [Saprospiraceae bacterium]
LYGEVADLLAVFGVRRLIGIGPEISAASAAFSGSASECRFYPNVDGFLGDIGRVAFQRETILLKGARAFAFERIASRLSRQNRHCTLHISLDALLHNFALYKRLLGPQVKAMAMVKAAAYGSGSAQVARALEHGGADYLGVAYADEGVALREQGISLPILVLNPSSDDFDLMRRYQLEPEIYNFELLHEAAKLSSADHPMRIHLKVDTGMRRLGFLPDELHEALRRIAGAEGLRAASIFSHLAASGAPEHDAFTRLQAERFEAACQIAEAMLGYRPLRHIVNSDGAIRFPEYRYDMARLGIGLYGIASDSDMRAQLRVVGALKARISQIRALSPGESVGYNRRGMLRRESRVATINVGYADGLLRLAGNGRYAFGLHGKEAPTVGSICMDMCMIDVTDIPEAREGDEVVVFGEHPRVEKLAEALQTIPYEVLTNISERVIRVYDLA